MKPRPFNPEGAAEAISEGGLLSYLNRLGYLLDDSSSISALWKLPTLKSIT